MSGEGPAEGTATEGAPGEAAPFLTSMDPLPDFPHHVIEIKEGTSYCQPPAGSFLSPCGRTIAPGQALEVMDNDDDVDSDEEDRGMFSGWWTARRLPTNKLRTYSQEDYPGGAVGLRNLGNTCYFNSALQCLSHCPLLSSYFTTETYREDVNLDNTLGTQGEIGQAYAHVLSRLWKRKYSHVCPKLLHSAFCKFRPMFRDMDQHDSHEAALALLDALAEDTNPVSKKPYWDAPDVDTRSPQQQCEESWEQHQKRDKSYVSSLFRGQVKMTLRCDVCGETSYKCDPMMDVQLSLQREIDKYVIVPVTFRDLKFKENPPRVYHCRVPMMGRMTDLKVELSKHTGVDPDKIFLLEVYRGRIYTVFDADEQVSGFSKEDKIYAYQIRQKVGEYSPPKPEPKPKEGEEEEEEEEEPADYEPAMVTLVGQHMVRDTWSRGSRTAQGLPLPCVMSLPSKANPAVVEASVINSFPEQLREVCMHYKEDYEKWPFRIIACKRMPPPKYGHHALELKQYGGYFPEAIATLARAEKSTTVFVEVQWNDYQSVADPAEPDEASLREVQAWQKSVRDEVLSVETLLANQSKDHQLEENDWYCKKCKEHRNPHRQDVFYRVPRVLWLHLKRFRTNILSEGRVQVKKLQHAVEYPLEGLDLTPYLDHPLPFKPMYDLYAVSLHEGDFQFGHYTALCRHANTGHWFSYNDQFVNPVHPDDVHTIANRPDAYMLFYQLRDPHPNCKPSPPWVHRPLSEIAQQQGPATDDDDDYDENASPPAPIHNHEADSLTRRPTYSGYNALADDDGGVMNDSCSDSDDDPEYSSTRSLADRTGYNRTGYGAL